MRLQLKNYPRQQFDVPREIAQILLLIPGSPVEAIPPPPAKRGKGNWQIVEGIFSGRVSLSASCSVCGSALNNSGQRAHEQRFIHCGTSESCPPEIAKQWREVYQRLEPGTGRLIHREQSNDNDPVLKAFRSSRIHCQV